MTPLLELGELDRTGIVLAPTAAERRALARLHDRLGVEWRADGSARIYSRGHVGTAALSADTVISVTTKVPVANILTLASLAYHSLPSPPAIGDALLESTTDVVDWLAVLLIAEIEPLQAHGLRQDYVTVNDELPYVRGRLSFDATLRARRPGFTACEFTDILPDIPRTASCARAWNCWQPSACSLVCAPASNSCSQAFTASRSSTRPADSCRRGAPAA